MAIQLAAKSKIRKVILDGVKRKEADEAVAFAGLLDYFPPGIVGPLLREASRKQVRLFPANQPDTDTISRNTWATLTTARGMGVNLGKYGCLPLTGPEIALVVRQIEKWSPGWSQAPVFFVDQGLVRKGAVDVGRDVLRGLKVWLTMVSSRGARIVLIDTVDKSLGRRLLKTAPTPKLGFLTLDQVETIERHAKKLRLKVLWAGGLSSSDVFELGKRKVFGVYVTTAASTNTAGQCRLR